MLTPSQLDVIRQADEDLDAIVIAEIRQTMQSAAGAADVQEFVDLLMQTVPEISDQFGGISALLATRAYDLGRATSDAPGNYEAVAAATAPLVQVQAGVRTALAPLWQQMQDRSRPVDLGQIRELTQSEMQSTVEKYVRQAGRDTIVENTLADPAKPRFVRVPKPGACGFCRSMAGRGAIYASAVTATVRSGGRKLRASGNRGARVSIKGNGYHYHCKCTAVAVYEGDELPSIVSDAQRFYAEASKGRSGAEVIRAANRAAYAEARSNN